jgi:hypothetical protein
MAQRLESSSGAQMGSSFLPVHEGRQQLSPPAGLVEHFHLPERYGIPLLELLVVDPYFVFISWEIPEAQLETARAHFGAEFERRRLQVRLTDSESGATVAIRALYGELGRWFIRLDQPGVWLRAELHYVAGEAELLLNAAGPVFVPRDTPVEPLRYEELHVTYGRGATGELTLEAVERERPGWPTIGLTLPGWSRPGEPAPTAPDHGPSSAALFSLTPTRNRVDSRLLRPLLPVAPAAVGEDEE